MNQSKSDIHPQMITTTLELPGRVIVKNVGIVRGIIVRSRSAVGSFLAGIQTIFGGNITLYTNMCEQARKEAFALMKEEASRHGANAIVGVRYDATELMPGVTEIFCYGTAVVVSRSSTHQAADEPAQTLVRSTTRP